MKVRLLLTLVAPPLTPAANTCLCGSLKSTLELHRMVLSMLAALWQRVLLLLRIAVIEEGYNPAYCDCFVGSPEINDKNGKNGKVYEYLV